jgi:hypothetical protein
MFVQVLQGHIHDRTDAREAVDRWVRDLAPGAEGWLGATAGVTADNMFIMLNRFDTPEAAQRNSHRHEHQVWWTEISKLFAREMALHDCTVTEMIGGDERGCMDHAGFVQVIQGKIPESDQSWAVGGRSGGSRPAYGPARVALARRVFHGLLGRKGLSWRPDFIGAMVGFDPQDGTLTEAAYFTSESAAREGERKQPPPDFAALLHEWQALIPDAQYFDLTDPWLFSPGG